MARLVRVVDAVAVLRPVDDAHIMVSHSTRVLAVFIITGAAAVLHRCLPRGDGVVLGDQVWLTRFLAQFCDLAAEREVAAMTCEATSIYTCQVLACSSGSQKQSRRLLDLLVSYTASSRVS